MMHNRVALLDYMRFFAAMIVVFFHYFFNGLLNGKITSIHELTYFADIAKYGYLGVDLFFIISGYVIFNSAVDRSPDKFIVGRMVRLYPAFWTAVCFTTLVSIFIGTERLHVGVVQFFANLTMMPQILHQPFVDDVYWTLMYEIRFYSMVFVLLLLGFSSSLIVAFRFWILALLGAYLLGVDSRLPMVGTYYSYFAAGALFAYCKKQGYDAVSLIGLGICYWLSVHYAVEKAHALQQAKGIEHSAMIVGATVTFFFAIFFILNYAPVYKKELPFSETLGALTYPVYLIHAHFGYMALSKFANEENKWIVYLVIISIVLLTAFLIHKVVEKNLKSTWFALFDKTAGRAVRWLTNIIERTMLRYRSAD